MPHGYMMNTEIDKQHLRLQIERHYQSLRGVQPEHYISGMHDNYLLQDGGNTYILRVYHHHWRTQDEVQYELALLQFLANKNCPVVAPLHTDQGNTSFMIQTVKGDRLAALFTFIEGDAPQHDMSSQQATVLGQGLARIHLASADFVTSYRRQRLDTEYLLHQSCNVITPYLSAAQQRTLHDMVSAIDTALPDLPMTSPCLTICHGDPNPGNLLFDATGELYLIDFDQCGPGWRVFDIAKFLAAIHRHDQLLSIKQACVKGYNNISQLSAIEMEALPLLAQMAAIWVAAIQVYNRPLTAARLADQDRWQQRLAVISKLPELLAG